jgi:hypothetical protein
MSLPSELAPLIEELTSRDPALAPILEEHAAASILLELLPGKYPPDVVITENGSRPWELVGLCFLNSGGFTRH